MSRDQTRVDGPNHTKSIPYHTESRSGPKSSKRAKMSRVATRNQCYSLIAGKSPPRFWPLFGEPNSYISFSLTFPAGRSLRATHGRRGPARCGLCTLAVPSTLQYPSAATLQGAMGSGRVVDLVPLDVADATKYDCTDCSHR